MKHIDYLVSVEGDEGSQDEIVYNIKTAKALASKMAKQFNARCWIEKFRDGVPADFDSHSRWVASPDGSVRER